MWGRDGTLITLRYLEKRSVFPDSYINGAAKQRDSSLAQWRRRITQTES